MVHYTAMRSQKTFHRIIPGRNARGFLIRCRRLLDGEFGSKIGNQRGAGFAPSGRNDGMRNLLFPVATWGVFGNNEPRGAFDFCDKIAVGVGMAEAMGGAFDMMSTANGVVVQGEAAVRPDGICGVIFGIFLMVADGVFSVWR